MKRVLSICILFFLFLAVMLTGCNPSSNGEYEVNWDIDLNNKIDLNTMFQNSGTTDTSFNDQTKGIIKTFQTETGYKVNYNQLPVSGADEILKRHLQNREPYHMMKLSRAQFEQNVFDEAFLPLNDLLDKWGGTITEKVKKSSWGAATLDGKIYAIPESGFGYMQDFALVFRTDMLVAAGVTQGGAADLPETIDEMTDVMIKLKTHYGAGNPQYMPLGYSGSTTIVKPVATALNIPARYYEDANGNVKHYIESPEMCTYLEQMGDWVSSGYSAKSFVTTTSQDVMQNLASGKISIGYLPYWYIDPLYSIMEANSVADPESKIDFVLNLKDKDGKYSYIQDEEVSYYMVIPFYMAENAGYVIDWINQRMTDEMWTRMSIGEKDVHYAEDADGNRQITERFNEVLDNSFYQTGGNYSVGKKSWALREKVFNCWQVMLSDEDEANLVKTSVVNCSPPFPTFSSLRERGESLMLGNFQSIMSDNKGATGWQSAINVWKARTWTDAASKEVNDWYKTIKK